MRRLLALFVTTTCVVGLAGGLTAGAAVATTPPVKTPSAHLADPVLRSSTAKQLLRKGPALTGGARSRSAAVDVSGPATAIINVTYAGFPTQAHDAFAAAVNIWAHTIHSSVPIDVSADWSNLTALYGDGILGAAGPTTFIEDFANTPKPNVWYPVALANAISGSDQLTANLCTNGDVSPRARDRGFLQQR